jgi:antitoxin component of MazEF toxin-antitoxin module|tara:strand:- start:163 stop:324 length:162 start_codon:yes stop_codon:yes gene_type:complete
MLKFKATIRKVGTSHVVTIPSDYVSNDLLKDGQEYIFHLTNKEADHNESPDLH